MLALEGISVPEEEAGGECEEVGGECEEVGGECEEVGGKCEEVDGECEEVGGECEEVGESATIPLTRSSMWSNMASKLSLSSPCLF